MGRRVFAIQDGGQCFTEGPPKQDKWKGNHKAYGVSDKCESDGKGGPMANEVYVVIEGNDYFFEKTMIAKIFKFKMYETCFIKCKFYSEAYCPQKCKVCKAGDSSDGGTPLNADGNCDYFCSNAGYCGIGKYYESGINCRECQASK